jgi:hypothetical protein
MTHLLPARWRREAAELRRLARQRQDEQRSESADRMIARADVWEQAAAELEQEQTDPSVHIAPE